MFLRMPPDTLAAFYGSEAGGAGYSPPDGNLPVAAVQEVGLGSQEQRRFCLSMQL